jgi:hypothetical protein
MADEAAADAASHALATGSSGGGGGRLSTGSFGGGTGGGGGGFGGGGAVPGRAIRQSRNSMPSIAGSPNGGGPGGVPHRGDSGNLGPAFAAAASRPVPLVRSSTSVIGVDGMAQAAAAVLRQPMRVPPSTAALDASAGGWTTDQHHEAGPGAGNGRGARHSIGGMGTGRVSLNDSSGGGGGGNGVGGPSASRAAF